jgi:lysophospholipase L1-like esterase
MTLAIDRIQIDALQVSPVTGPVNLSIGPAAAPRHAALDWWKAPESGAVGLANPIRKAGANLLNVSILGGDQGFGVGAILPFSWNDGPVGSGSYAHTSNTQTVGWGYQITCPVPRWPDWQVLRFWEYSSSPRMIAYDASMDDTDAVTQVEYVGGTGFGTNADNNYAMPGGARLIEVKFCSELPGKTLTFRARRNGTSTGYYMILAAGLYHAIPNRRRPRGTRTPMLAGTLFSPIGGPGLGASPYRSSMVVGNQFGSTTIFDKLPIFVDMLKQGVYTNLGGSRGSIMSPADGYPAEDFRVVHQARMTEVDGNSRQYTWLVEGNPGTVSFDLGDHWTLDSVVYDPATDTAVIKTTSPADPAYWNGIRLHFTGTKRTPASAVGSGVRSIKMIRPGYEATPTRNLTSELVSYAGDYGELRTMKLQNIEQDPFSLTWANAPRRTMRRGIYNYPPDGSAPIWDAFEGRGQGLAIEDLVDICNACNANLWAVVPVYADSSWEAGLAVYVEANLNANLTATYEYSNEAWNPSYYHSFRWPIVASCAECKGFWLDFRSERTWTSFVVAGNVATIVWNAPHGATTGDQFFAEINAVNAVYTLTVVNPTTMTIPYVASDGEKINAPWVNSGGQTIPGMRGNGSNLNSGSPLLTGGSLSDVTFWSPVGQRYRWYNRRCVQMSDAIRAVVPTAKFMTRHNPVIQHHMGQLSLFMDAAAAHGMAWLGTTLAAKFRAMGGGGYFFGDLEQNGANGSNVGVDYSVLHTAADYNVAFTTGANRAKRDYIYDHIKVLCLQQGIEFWNYEGGPDMSSYPQTDPASPYFGPHKLANTTTKKEFKYTDRWREIVRDFVYDQQRLGIDKYIEFNLQVIGRHEYGTGHPTTSDFMWETSADLVYANSPQWQGYREAILNPVSHDWNRVPASIDARAFLGEFGDLSAKPYPTLSNSFLVWQNAGRTTGTIYFPTPKTKLQYLVFAPTTGMGMTLRLVYKTLIATARTVTITLNGATIGTIALPSLGVGVTGTSAASLSLPMRPRGNAIEIVRDTDNASFELRSLVLTAIGAAVVEPRHGWFKIANEDEVVAVNGRTVRFGNTGLWTTPAAIAGTITATAAYFGLTHNTLLLRELQTNDPAAALLRHKIMVLGDSITGNQGPAAWRTRLSQTLIANAANFSKPVDYVGNGPVTYNDGSEDFDHSGHGGYTTAHILNAAGTGTGPGPSSTPFYWRDARDLVDWFVNQSPDIVIMHFGSNDASGAIVVSTIMAAYSAFLAKAREVNPRVVFVVAQIIGRNDAGMNANVVSINNAIPGWAAANTTAASPIVVVDQYTGFDPTIGVHTSDGLHPNSAGAIQMAGRFYTAIQPYIT